MIVAASEEIQHLFNFRLPSSANLADFAKDGVKTIGNKKCYFKAERHIETKEGGLCTLTGMPEEACNRKTAAGAKQLMRAARSTLSYAMARYAGSTTTSRTFMVHSSKGQLLGSCMALADPQAYRQAMEFKDVKVIPVKRLMSAGNTPENPERFGWMPDSSKIIEFNAETDVKIEVQPCPAQVATSRLGFSVKCKNYWVIFKNLRKYLDCQTMREAMLDHFKRIVEFDEMLSPFDPATMSRACKNKGYFCAREIGIKAQSEFFRGQVELMSANDCLFRNIDNYSPEIREPGQKIFGASFSVIQFPKFTWFTDCASIAVILEHTIELDILDLIARQVDRHGGNMFYSLNPVKSAAPLQAIDLDMSWGVRPSLTGGKLKLFPPMVTTTTYHRIKKITPLALMNLFKNVPDLMKQRSASEHRKKATDIWTMMDGALKR